MICGVFKAVVVMSAVSSCTAVVLMLTRLLSGGLWSMKLRYRAWIAVLMLAILPFSFSFGDDRGNAETDNKAVTIYQTIPHDTLLRISDSNADMLNSVQTSEAEAKVSYMFVLSRLWMTAAFLKLAVFVLNYFRFLRKALKSSHFLYKHKSVYVYETDIFRSPIAVGILKKKIFLPCGISDKSREYVMMHELTHFKHNDLMFKWFAAFAKCIHWFNPIFYFVSRTIDKDGEIFCDITVCRNMDENEKRDYMNIILDLISPRTQCSVCTAMSDSKKDIIKRFSAIKNDNGKQKFLLSAVGVCLMAAIFFGAVAASGKAGGLIYDKNMPVVSFDFAKNNRDKKAVDVYTGKSSAENGETVFPEPILESADYSETEPDIEDAVEEKHDTVLNEADYHKDNNDNMKLASDSKSPANTESDFVSSLEEAMGKIDESSDDINTAESAKNIFSLQGEDAATREIIDDDYAYPYSGSIKYDGLTLSAISADIENSGGVKVSPDSVDLKKDYVSDTLSYLNGGVAEIKNVICDSKGQVSFYMDSEYDQHIEISFEQNGKQVAGYGIIPDNETTYVFGGFNPEEEYDIRISSSTGSTWKVENEYIIY